MANILSIDTSDNKQIQISLEVDGQKTVITSDSKTLRSEACLILINQLLKKKKLTPKDISEIKVNRGPGSFTGLRVGIAIANAVSTLLNIPVNNKPIGQLEEPVYN